MDLKHEGVLLINLVHSTVDTISAAFLKKIQVVNIIKLCDLDNQIM